MKTAYFRVIKFIPDERVLQLDTEGLDDPNADIVYCEWDDSPGQGQVGYCKVHHGDNVYESPSYMPAVIYANFRLRDTIGQW